MNEQELANYKSPCALLENGACSVYDARPMACRIYLSTKLETCLEFYNHPDNEHNYPALIELPLRAGRMMNEGFMAALKEHGIETAEFRLEQGLSIVLKNDQPSFGK
jgi:Fe-S-cluster containining protein